MKNTYRNIALCILLFSLPFMVSCDGQMSSNKEEEITSASVLAENAIHPTDNSIESKKGNTSQNSYNFSDGVRCGLLDKKGILWFGTNYGLYSYDGTAFTHFTQENGLCNESVFSIMEDNKGDLWFGTENGLCHYNRETFTHVPIPYSDTSSVWLDKVYPIINPNAVESLIQDKKGNIWIGTGGGGAYRYDPMASPKNGSSGFTSFLADIGRKQTDSLHHNWIPSITEDAEGNIWFASMTHGGASRYDGESFTHYMPKDGLTDDMVRVIFLDKSGNLWFGYNGNRNSGLSRYDGKSFTNFYKSDGLCNKRIRGIYEDSKGKLWLGGDLQDVCIYDGESFETFVSKNGQNMDSATFILDDTLGNIWFGGRNGLSKYDGETITRFTQEGY